VFHGIPGHFLAVHGEQARPSLAQARTVGLEVEDDGVLAGAQLWPCPNGALEVKQVVEEHRLARTNPRHTLAQEKSITAEAPAFGDDEELEVFGTGRKTFSLKTDVDLLEEMCREIGTVVLIIIDPVSAYMGGADGNGNVETREVLEPCAEMGNRRGIAIVAVTHLNKGGTGNQSALNRFAGSIAFVAAARSAYLIIEDPEDENRRLFLQAKNNLAPKSKGLAFRVEQRLIADGIVASNISWESDYVTASVDEALSASESRGGNENRSGKDEAAGFLRDVLAGGPVDVSEVETMARSAGLLGDNQRLGQNKAFQNARKELGATSDREGFGKGARYVLSLPNSPCAPENIMCAPLQSRAHMDNPGAHGGSETSS
jgi:putative DNA primase/helicase